MHFDFTFRSQLDRFQKVEELRCRPWLRVIITPRWQLWHAQDDPVIKARLSHWRLNKDTLIS